jgi:hypothetical protein
LQPAANQNVKEQNFPVFVQFLKFAYVDNFIFINQTQSQNGWEEELNKEATGYISF